MLIGSVNRMPILSALRRINLNISHLRSKPKIQEWHFVRGLFGDIWASFALVVCAVQRRGGVPLRVMEIDVRTAEGGLEWIVHIHLARIARACLGRIVCHFLPWAMPWLALDP